MSLCVPAATVEARSQQDLGTMPIRLVVVHCVDADPHMALNHAQLHVFDLLGAQGVSSILGTALVLIPLISSSPHSVFSCLLCHHHLKTEVVLCFVFVRLSRSVSVTQGQTIL